MGSPPLVLACRQGGSDKEVAARLGVCVAAVGTWRRRFAQRRLDDEAASERDFPAIDPRFAEKFRDVVGLFISPPERAIVPSVDEKSQVPAVDLTQPLLPMTPGQAERHTHDYVRDGTTPPSAALNVATGQVIGRRHRRQRQQAFLRFLNELDSKL